MIPIDSAAAMNDHRGMNDFALVIVAGGSGSRMKAEKKKAFIQLADQPMLLHTARAFADVPGIGAVVVVVPAEELRDLTGGDATYDTGKADINTHPLTLLLRDAGVSTLAAGGPRRQDSVRNGLHATPELAFVMVHDAARPFVQPDDLQRLIQRTRETGAAILAHPVRDTLKRAKGNSIEATVSRAELWGAQTPQAFKRAELLAAFEKHGSQDVTDDAELWALAGGRCEVVQGSALNFKVTTPEDLKLAEALLAVKSAERGDIRPASAIFRRMPGGDTIFDLEPPA